METDMLTGKKPLALCMVATPFQADGALDEAGLRAHLRRMVESGCSVYLGSGGTGEGHALSLAELTRVYEIGVEECKGRVATFANPPEPRTGKAMIDTCRAAAAAGVDMVQIYQMDAGHSMRPTAAEQERYYRAILDAVDHPIALSVHFYSGYLPSTALFRKLCDDYPQIVAVNVIGTPIGYYVELKDALDPRIALYVLIKDVFQGLTLGAAGYLAAEPNIAPYLCRSIVEHFVRGEIEQCGEAIANVARLSSIVTRWAPANPRWVKMAMKVLNLPGGNGVLREPYLLPPAAELDEMARAFEKLGLRRIEEAAKAACSRAPS
jgi:4-hydroxy-tetrahydrodipicolinate synthase